MKLGRLVHHDPRSRGFAYPALPTKPVSVTHRIDAAALDQQNLGACTGFAAAQWLNTRAAVANRKRFNKFRPGSTSHYTNDFDGRALYSVATHLDDFPGEYPPTDEGSSGLGAAKALQSSGAIDRYEHTFSFDAFLAALQRQPVLIGTQWTQGMFNPDRNGIIKPTGAVAGGHEYLGVGINWPRKLIRIRNSWSSQWGVNGDAYIPMNDMERLLVADGDCTVPVVG